MYKIVLTLLYISDFFVSPKMDFDYDSDSTAYYPNADTPDLLIVELSNVIVYVDRSFSKNEILEHIINEIRNLNIKIYNTNNIIEKENLLDELFNHKELYLFILNNYM